MIWWDTFVNSAIFHEYAWLTHIALGIFTVLSIFADRIFPVLLTSLFTLYQFDEDFRVKDFAFYDLRDFSMGFCIGIVLILIINIYNKRGGKK
jgi:hypothetical protein